MDSSSKQLATYNQAPNFSIVLPGKCNAKCAFCFWKEKPEDPNFLKTLKTTLLDKPKIFRQISVTGGEPCLSPQLVPVLKLLQQFKDANRLDKVVLTTNGSALLYKLSRHKCMSAINHINISRHSPDYMSNLGIFGTDFIPTDQELKEACEISNIMGIDVTINCVISDDTQGALIPEMIRYAKSIGASHVSFRKQHGVNLDPTPAEEQFKEYKSINEGCPICRTKWQIIDGMLINWKASIPEPINAPSFAKGSMIYEAIYHPDAEMTADWKAEESIIFRQGHIFSGKTKISAVDAEIKKLYDKMYKVPTKITKDKVQSAISSYSYSGCGGGGGGCGSGGGGGCGRS